MSGVWADWQWWCDTCNWGNRDETNETGFRTRAEAQAAYRAHRAVHHGGAS